MFSSAWTSSEKYPSDQKATTDTINYWGSRLGPIIDDKTTKDHCYFICSNRVGVELEEQYMGSSCILILRPSIGIISNLTKKE